MKINKELLKEYIVAKGDKKERLRNEIVTRYLSVVMNQAFYFAKLKTIGYLCDCESAINCGVIGFSNGLKGVKIEKLSTADAYLKKQILWSVIKEISRQSIISRCFFNRHRKLEGKIQSLELEKEYSLNDEEIAKELGIDVEYVRKYRKTPFIFRFDTATNCNEDNDNYRENIINTIKSEEEDPIQKILIKELINLIFNGSGLIKEKEKKVLRMYYYEKLRAWEIGKSMNVSRSRIYQIRNDAISKIRRKLLKEGMTLDDFVCN